jgi:prolipoprotein diacylglyceryl transferase
MNLLSFLSYITWDVNPDAFTIPFIDHPVKWYGLSWALGFLLGQQIMYFIYKREGESVKDVDTLTLYIIVSALIGARFGHFLFYDPSVFITDPLQILLPPYAGLASHGGAIGTALGVYFYAKKENINYLWIVDRLVIITALAGCFIRLGNLMNSEVVGTPTTVPWAFIFVAFDGIPRHPAQLYEAIYCFFLFLILFWLWSTKRTTLNNGVLTGWFLIVLFTLRFVDEFFKINQEPFEADLVLNMGQILSIPFVIIGVVILLLSRYRGNKGIRPSQLGQANPERA